MGQNGEGHRWVVGNGKHSIRQVRGLIASPGSPLCPVLSCRSPISTFEQIKNEIDDTNVVRIRDLKLRNTCEFVSVSVSLYLPALC